MIQLRIWYCELACMKTLILWIGKNLYTMYLLFFFFLASLQLTPTQVQPKNFKWRTFFDSPFCIWLLFHFRVAFISLEVGFCWSSRISNSFLVCSVILHTQRNRKKHRLKHSKDILELTVRNSVSFIDIFSPKNVVDKNPRNLPRL